MSSVSNRCSLPALVSAMTSSAAVKNLVSMPRSTHANPIAMARWVFPLWKTFHKGKTHMASALCMECCQARREARFFTASSLVMRLRRARDEGRLDRELARIGHADLLVIDELGFLPLDADGARLLFQVVSEAYERQSVVLTTNLEFSRWGTVFGDDQMAAAVIDRVVHHGRLLQFHGESYRLTHALMQDGGAQR